MKILKVIGVMLAIIIGMAALSWGFGWLDVFFIKTVGKAKQDATSEVFYMTQSYKSGKRQDATRMYKEYYQSDEKNRKMIANMLSSQFAEIPDDQLEEVFSGDILNFVKDCKLKGYYHIPGEATGPPSYNK